MTLKHKIRIYNKLWNEINELQKQYNICDVVIKNGKFTCRRDSGWEQNGCCIGCQHMYINKGCSVKSLMCKMWVCDAVIKDQKNGKLKAEPYFIRLKEISQFLVENEIPFGFRYSKKESFTIENNIFHTRKWYLNNVRVK